MTKTQLKETFAMEQVTETFSVRHFTEPALSAILAIEKTLPDPWTEEEVKRAVRKRNAVTQIVELRGRIVGYSIRNVGVGAANRMIEVVRMAVYPKHRRRGAGTALLGRVQDKMCVARRDGVFCEVSDAALGTHLFLRAMGFKAVSILRRGDGDAYIFEWLKRS